MSSEVQVSYYDLSRIVASVAALQAQTNQINGNIITVNNNVRDVDNKVNHVNRELADLREKFVQMMKEQRMAAALQRALTEIIRIRQELEQKYGSYQLVRNTMLGILEANDLELVRSETIATASEELMISTPKYWLAPCVIALSAWIADNKELAERALREALKRDAEKTSLVFALICSKSAHSKDPKNNEIKTIACLKWLNCYFKMQKANQMKRSIITYINAYVNGVFGANESKQMKEICDFDSHVAKWMKDLEENGTLEIEQSAYWAEFYESKCKNIHQDYPVLANTCPQFEQINAYVRRINAIDEIYDHFAGIAYAEVRTKDLEKLIYHELKTLVSKYDEEEVPLREEEELMTEIKRLQGDEEYAKRIIAARKIKRADPSVNFAEQLTQAITSPDTGSDIASARKTSCKFLSKYIVPAYHKFIGEKRSEFPEGIDIKFDDWSGSTTDGSNKDKLKRDYASGVNAKRNAELSTIKKPTSTLIAAAIIFVLSIIIAVVAENPVFFVLGAIVTGVVALTWWNKKKKNKANEEAINNKYDETIRNGCAIIEKAIGEWVSILTLVNGFVPQNISDLEILTIREAK